MPYIHPSNGLTIHAVRKKHKAKSITFIKKSIKTEYLNFLHMPAAT
jgi:hypothetical protein